jgi:uncharacterized alpha-E superfamily protein
MKSQLLTANVATNLYWFGRHLERIELSLLEINDTYDQIIDVDKDAGVELYKKYGITLEYSNALGFLAQAIRGDHPANLANIMVNARENAIIGRPNIDASAFGEVMDLHELLHKMGNSICDIDYKDIDTALSLISEIWGAHEKRGHRRCSDYFLKLGKLIEEVDFRLRFDKDMEMTDLIIEDINMMFKILNPDFDSAVKKFKEGNKNIMEDLYKNVDQLIVG